MDLNKTTSYIIITAAVLLLLTAFVLMRDKEKEYDWEETYLEDSKEPFGSFVLRELIKSYFPGESVTDLKDKIAKSLPDTFTGKPANYIFLGPAIFTDSLDLEKLIHFVHNGNNAFIAAEILPNYLMRTIYSDDCTILDSSGINERKFRRSFAGFLFNSVIRDSVCFTNFTHPQLAETHPLKYAYPKHSNYFDHYTWDFFDTLAIQHCSADDMNATVLGVLDTNYVNFVKIPYDKGTFYIHTNPLFFTNYYMIDAEKAKYAAKVFSHLQPGTIYWDKKSRVPRSVGESLNGMGNNKWNKEGPLKYILSQPSLAWAWYIFLSLILLYILFLAKRRQRIIPVLEDKSNTSLEFIRAIGKMYFAQGNHISVCIRQLKHFRTFVREQYHLSSKDMDTDFIEALSTKSGVHLDQVQYIAGFEQKLKILDITEDTMVALHQALQSFYQTCK